MSLCLYVSMLYVSVSLCLYVSVSLCLYVFVSVYLFVCLLFVCWSHFCLFFLSLVPEYEVISPFQADDAGQFITHELHKRSRTKRSTSQPDSWFYKMDAFGFSLHLNVTKAKHLLAPGSIVETTHENGSKSYTSLPKNTFYSGHVVSHPGSVAAISNQGGLVSNNVRGLLQILSSYGALLAKLPASVSGQTTLFQLVSRYQSVL